MTETCSVAVFAQRHATLDRQLQEFLPDKDQRIAWWRSPHSSCNGAKPRDIIDEVGSNGCDRVRFVIQNFEDITPDPIWHHIASHKGVHEAVS